MRIHADAAGNEWANLDDEYVVFENTGDGPLSLGGWTVSDASGRTYTVPDGTSLAPDQRITLHTGSGTDAEAIRTVQGRFRERGGDRKEGGTTGIQSTVATGYSYTV